MKIFMKGAVCLLLMCSIAIGTPSIPARGDDRILLRHDRGIIPLVDLESSLRREDCRALLTDFCHRLLVGLDYGGGRKSLDRYISEKAKTRRLITRCLPEEAQDAMVYRNALVSPERYGMVRGGTVERCITEYVSGKQSASCFTVSSGSF